jgi:hypothetical protein
MTGPTTDMKLRRGSIDRVIISANDASDASDASGASGGDATKPFRYG